MKYVITANVDLFMNVEAPNKTEAKNRFLSNVEEIKNIANVDVNELTIVKEKSEK